MCSSSNSSKIENQTYRHKVHFVREQIPSGKMTLKYPSTTIMIADNLTKENRSVRLAQICKLFFGSDLLIYFDILFCDWSISRHECLQTKDSKRNCNFSIRERRETILTYEFKHFKLTFKVSRLNKGCLFILKPL